MHTPRSTGGPEHAPGTPGLDIGAADEEVESVGSRRVPLVVQSEQDKMLRYHVSLLTHCLNDGLDLGKGYQVSRLPLDVWPRVKAKDRLGVLQQFKTWGFLALIGHHSKLQQVCDMKANPRYRGVPNAAALSARKERASRARKFRSHLTLMTEIRRRVIDTESDNMADMVPSQGATSVSSHVQYGYKTHDYGRRCNLVRANVLPSGTQDFDMVNAMTNLVVQAMDKLELPQWLPTRELPHWRHYADHTARLRVEMQANLGPSAKRVILSVAHGEHCSTDR